MEPSMNIHEEKIRLPLNLAKAHSTYALATFEASSPIMAMTRENQYLGLPTK